MRIKPSSFLVFFLCLITIANNVHAANRQKYYSVRIPISSQLEVSRILMSGIDPESIVFKDGSYLEAVVSDDEVKTINDLGLKYDVVIDDLESYYGKVLRSYIPDKKLNNELLSEQNYKPGSMGGFFRLKEIYENFDRMKSKFPGYFISTDTIGFTVENRPLIAYTLGNKSTEPANSVLFTALHHAREPAGVSVLIYFLWNILEKAADGDKEAQYLLENRKVYVIPVVNPDGYYYNETTNPGGGGLWRKNRRQTSDSTWGIDVNRNYGPYEYWNSAVDGSSVKPKDATYRGDSAFSEQETRAVRDFCLSHNIQTALNYHTFGNFLIYPNGALKRETKDSVLFRSMACDMSRFSRLAWGMDQQTVGYSARGNSDDWMTMTDSQKKQRIMAMTCEAGSDNDGFWPTQDRVLALAKESLYMNYQVVWNAVSNLRPAVIYPEFDTVSKKAYVYVTVRNTGVSASLPDSKLTISTTDNKINIIGPQRSLPELKSAGEKIEIFEIAHPDKAFINGSPVPFEITILQDGVERKDTFSLKLYHYISQDLPYTTGNSMWESSSGWGEEKDSETNESVLSDSPYSDYRDSLDNYITLKDPILIKNEPSVTLQFMTKWSIENRYDFAILQASTDNGQTWETLRTSLMKQASGQKTSKQTDTTQWGFYAFNPYWERQQASLDKFRGKSILIRFGMLSDRGVHFDGWKIKDIKLKYYLDMDYLSAIEVNSGSSGLKLYPVPLVKGSMLNIELQDKFVTTGASITVFDINSNIVLSSRVAAGESVTVLSTELLPQATYYIKISNGSTEEYSSFVVR